MSQGQALGFNHEDAPTYLCKHKHCCCKHSLLLKDKLIRLVAKVVVTSENNVFMNNSRFHTAIITISQNDSYVI